MTSGNNRIFRVNFLLVDRSIARSFFCWLVYMISLQIQGNVFVVIVDAKFSYLCNTQRTASPAHHACTKLLEHGLRFALAVNMHLLPVVGPFWSRCGLREMTVS